MTTTGFKRIERHYEKRPEKPEILRLWQQHVTLSDISRRLGISLYTVSDIIHQAMVDGEIIEERKILHEQKTD